MVQAALGRHPLRVAGRDVHEVPGDLQARDPRTGSFLADPPGEVRPLAGGTGGPGGHEHGEQGSDQQDRDRPRPVGREVHVQRRGEHRTTSNDPSVEG